MKKELKFRAWVYGKMTEPFTLEEVFKDGAFIDWNFDKSLIMQFTGLLDKNGVEVYEGDIINNEVATWEVVFNRGCFSAKMKGDNRTGDILHIALRAIIDYKIIGNKFENPELL